MKYIDKIFIDRVFSSIKKELMDQVNYYHYVDPEVSYTASLYCGGGVLSIDAKWPGDIRAIMTYYVKGRIIYINFYVRLKSAGEAFMIKSDMFEETIDLLIYSAVRRIKGCVEDPDPYICMKTKF